MLTLTDLHVRRGAEEIVAGLTLEVRPGEVFWVLGPNGAGKSSLLRVMALLDAPVAGRVEYSGGQSFLYFHSEMRLPAWSTVGAWERLVRRLLPPGAAAPPTQLRPTLGPGRRIGRLSTGERKRLLLDALFRTPGPMLVDEPHEHLSPDAKATLTRLLSVRAERDVVVVATNQIPYEADIGRGLRLEGGVAEPVGTGAEA